MPKPKKGESQQQFISRCISQKVKEGVDQEQAIAICYSQWDNRNKKKSMEFKSVSIDAYSEDEENNELILTGYGAVFGNVDSYNDIIAKGAFLKTINENKDRIAFCYQHDIYNPIGKITMMQEDEKGLLIEVRISDAEDDIKTKIREGILKEMSIGFQTVKSEWDEEKQIRTIKEVKLWEVSLVTLAANPLAMVTAMKSEEKRDYISEQIDKIYAIVNQRELKFELLKLKSLIEALPTEMPQEQKEPIFDINEFKNVLNNTLKF